MCLGPLDLEWRRGLIIIVALALPLSASGQADTPPPIEIPAIEATRPLSVAELRWCMSQEVGLEAIQSILGTVDAIDHQNELAIDFNRRCGARQYTDADAEEAMRYVDGVREAIAAAAIEDIQERNDRALTRQVQESLAALGYQLATDGNYGTETEEVIRSFQLRVGIPADGLVSKSLLGRLHVEYMRIFEGRE